MPAASATDVIGHRLLAAANDPYAGKTLQLPNGASLEIPPAVNAEASFDCAAAYVLCVPGEFKNLQAAADAAAPGDVVLAESTRHESFVIEKSGTADAPIRFIARAGATIERYRETDHAIEIRSDFTRDFYTDYIHIIGFTFKAPPASCIDFADAISTRPTRGHVISNNRCLDASEHGFYLSQVSESYIAHNFIADAGRGDQRHGIYYSNGGTGNNITYGNIIVGAENNGIHCNGDRYVDYLADGSRGGARGTDGLVSGMIFDANIILFSGQSGINLDGVQSALFVNNVIQESRRHGVRGYVIDGSAGPAGLEFVNNTFIGNRSAIKLTDGEPDAGFVLLNNLFVDHEEEAVVIDTEYRERASTLVNDVKFVNPASDGRIGPDRAATLDYRVRARYIEQIRNGGSTKLEQVVAPSLDLYGVSRGDSPDIGAVEHQ